MKPKLEVFKDIIVLQIFERLELQDLEVLQMGFNRLLQLQLKWLIVDLTHCLISDEALLHFIKVRPQLEEKSKGLILVGPSPDLCHYTEIVDAYHACKKAGSNEADSLIEKWELEQRVLELEQKKAVATDTGLAELSMEQKKTETTRLRRETFRLKKLQSFLINDMVRQAYHTKKGLKLPDGAGDLKDRCNSILVQLKLLPEEPKK